ncbi:MAG: hypothetical protein M1818_003702 [Claussenomyces sp. TS43310]|nr:MAG: hypothetical protein M1818_003702 [Claussenomyces sp. TS43310]
MTSDAPTMKGRKPLTVVIKLGEIPNSFPIRNTHAELFMLKGTSSIVDEKTHEPLLSILSLIVETAVKLRQDGHRVVIVSSGAIGVGLRRMDVERRPKLLPQVQVWLILEVSRPFFNMFQALAAIGQSRLIGIWDTLFSHLRQPIGQILLTRNDIADVRHLSFEEDLRAENLRQRTQYLNAQNTFTALLEMGAIPIVNENDTLAVTEIKFGDNDTLSAITAAMVHADYLFLMTDVDCLYDKNPRTYADARAIEVVEDIATLQADVSSAGSSLGTGGMSTKIIAARLATSAGVTTVITRSSNPGNIVNIVRYVEASKASAPSSVPGTPPQTVHQVIDEHLEEPLARSTASISIESPIQAPLHTRFVPSHQPIRDRYFWILHGLAPHGTIYIDAGAHRALEKKAGLLPVGVIDVEGNFAQQEAVRLVVVNRVPSTRRVLQGGALWEGTPIEVGRALVNYSAAEIARIKGVRSSEITGLLGYADSEYVALRENISFFVRESRPATPSLEH